MITFHQPPAQGAHVIQMKSRETGQWVDVVTGLGEPAASASLGRWRSIHPGREFRLIRRTFIEEVIPG